MKRLAVLAALLAAAAIGARAQDKACTAADAAAAEKQVDMVVAWPQLYDTWQKFRHCDKGTVDELFTDAILRLAVEWKHVDVFAETMRKDPQFKAFVYRHLQSPAAKDDRESVYARAKKDCTASLKAFCDEVADIVQSPGAGSLAPMAPMAPIRSSAPEAKPATPK